MAEKIFVSGFQSQDIPDTVPEFILGKTSIKIDDFQKFLEDNKKYAVKGYLNLVTLRSKSTGKRYTELDLYQYNKSQGEGMTSAQHYDAIKRE